MAMEGLASEVVSCTKCPLCNTRTNAVPGKGSFKADVVLIGEAPGQQEDSRGEPFVGAAGRRLSDALERAGVARESVYITNVVKCRPPGNRVPTEEERAACIGYLHRELDAIGPLVTCILGNTAFKSVLGGTGITKYRGKTVMEGGRMYFMTIHPAATIYRQELVDVLAADIARLFGIASEMKRGRQVEPDIAAIG